MQVAAAMPGYIGAKKTVSSKVSKAAASRFSSADADVVDGIALGLSPPLVDLLCCAFASLRAAVRVEIVGLCGIGSDAARSSSGLIEATIAFDAFRPARNRRARAAERAPNV